MVEIVEGRRYAVFNKKTGEREEGPAVLCREESFDGFRVAGWYVLPDGKVNGVEHVYGVEAIEESRPELSVVSSLKERRVAALERIADALEALARKLA